VTFFTSCRTEAETSKEPVMTFFHRDRARVCGPEVLFEELEERIVMDASVDPSVGAGDVFGQASFDHHTAHTGTDALLHGTATHEARGNWELGYSSDPSTTMASMLDVILLDGYDGTLSPVNLTVDNTTVLYPPFTSTIGLGGRIFVQNTDPDTAATVQVTLSVPAGGAWTALTATAAGAATVTGSGTTVVLIVGSDPDVNGTLSSLVGSLPSGFYGNTQIDVSAVDLGLLNPPNPVSNDSLTAIFVGDPPLVNAPLFQIVASNTLSPIGGVFVDDIPVHELGVVVEVNHGTLVVPQQPPGLLIPSLTYFGTEGPDGAPLPVGPLVGVRGQLPELQAALAGLQYRSLPGFHGVDVLSIVATDGAFRPILGLSTLDTVPILVV
jgi:hypothetical protein